MNNLPYYIGETSKLLIASNMVYKMKISVLFLGLIVLSTITGCTSQSVAIPVKPSLEDRTADGGYHNPTTQSFLRGRHWLEKTSQIEITQNKDAEIQFHNPESDYHLSLVSFPMAYLVPRLNYRVSGQPDDFDAFNLRLAEYARNSISVPVAKSGDSIAHFETNLPETVPWTLDGDYTFVPNPHTRPVRLGLINNCLDPGLWEISAADRSGEIYHAWFDFPLDKYHHLVATTNHLDQDFVTAALQWSEEKPALKLERLRTPLEELQPQNLSILEQLGSRGFSSQDSRRKLARGYAQVGGEGDWHAPTAIVELTAGPARLNAFVQPGKYALNHYRSFDLAFLRKTRGAQIRRVEPHTNYNPEQPVNQTFDYLELTIELEDYTLVLGNLPRQLMVPQEDFAIHGFGVGVLSSSGLAERRAYLFQEGPAPSFAYLAEQGPAGVIAVNSHAYGLEQVFIRTHLAEEGQPFWEIIITSYERIVDLIKYRVPIPAELVAKVRADALSYIAPLYFTYRDDNLR